MTRPIIGIASRRIPFINDNKPYPRYGVAISYCDAVERSGGILVIFPLSDDKAVLAAIREEVREFCTSFPLPH